MSRRNRVDPLGDLHAVDARGMFTGNRGCLVDKDRNIVRHHSGTRWIICATSFRELQHPLDAPSRWTPVFFLDEAVGLAAGHRPCSYCRHAAYVSYQDAVTRSSGRLKRWTADEINDQLAAERLRAGAGLERAADRRLRPATLGALPTGAVVLVDNLAHLVGADGLRPFSFSGWGQAMHRSPASEVQVITPPLSIAALANGYEPELHPTASE